MEYVETLPSFSSVVVAAWKPAVFPSMLCFSASAVLNIEWLFILPSESYSEPIKIIINESIVFKKMINEWTYRLPI